MWKDELYFGHWIAYMPGEERMAISKVDLHSGSVKPLHRFTTLSSCIEASLIPDQALEQPTGMRIIEVLKGRLPAQKQQFRCQYASSCTPSGLGLV